MKVEFGVLGPVEVRLDGVPLVIGPRQQAILAVLLVEVNRPVSVDTLLERVWDERRPARPANAVQTQLTLLRRSLATVPDVGIAWQTGGYRLTTDPATVDLHRFLDLLDRPRATPDEQVAQRLTQVLELWRGEPFAGVELPWFAATRASLRAQRDSAALDLAEIRVRLGQFESALDDLRDYTAAHPLDERAAGYLIRALHGTGRSSEAVRYYEQLRDRLVEELGADPDPRLSELAEQVRTNGVTAPSSSAPGTTDPVPRQLPSAPASFTGRAAALATMTAILDNATESAGTVIISAISGTGGIGKSWLTLHWAHLHRDRFPDGQLFVDLRGFSPANDPMASATAVRGFLDALGVPADRIPTSLDAQSSLWRTLVADKRMLIVLDNAADTEQVRPLLPGSSTSTVLVNSRDRLSGLVTGHGAHQVVLDILADADARELLRVRLGAERLAAEPEAVDELLALCGGFPLALGIVAGHALSHPDFPIAALVAELREHRLLVLDDADQSGGLSSVLSWSYRALPDPAARAFALLGAAPGADVGVEAVAALVDRPLPEATRLLRALERASLVHQHAPGRYLMHDLVRAYSREQAGAETDAALRRITDFYLYSNLAAELTVYQSRPRIALPPPITGAQPRTFESIVEATEWRSAEYQNLLATLDETLIRGWHATAWHLVWTLAFHQIRTGHLLDAVATCRQGLASTLRLGDRAGEAIARQLLGYACVRAEQFDEAQTQLTTSIQIATELGDATTELFSTRYLCILNIDNGNLKEAEVIARRAVALAEQSGNPVWLSAELNHIAWIAANLGEFEYAKPHGDRALELRVQYPGVDTLNTGNIQDCLGFIANGMGEYEQAIRYYEQARANYALTSSLLSDLVTLEHLGHPYLALGKPDKAREVWEAALRVRRDQQRFADVARIQALLDGLPPD